MSVINVNITDLFSRKYQVSIKDSNEFCVLLQKWFKNDYKMHT